MLVSPIGKAKSSRGGRQLGDWSTIGGIAVTVRLETGCKFVSVADETIFLLPGKQEVIRKPNNRMYRFLFMFLTLWK
jgi:hypothetical protein